MHSNTAIVRLDRSKGSLTTPSIAWPTVILMIGVLVGWVLTISLVGADKLSLLTGSILSTVLAYVSFTPLHDAAHRSVGRPRWINEVVGRFAGILLMAPFPAFRSSPKGPGVGRHPPRLGGRRRGSRRRRSPLELPSTER